MYCSTCLRIVNLKFMRNVGEFDRLVPDISKSRGIPPEFIISVACGIMAKYVLFDVHSNAKINLYPFRLTH